MEKFKPELSAAKAATIGAIVGFGSTASGNPTLPTLITGATTGIAAAVANRKEKKKFNEDARQAHRAVSPKQFRRFKTEAGYSKDL